MAYSATYANKILAKIFNGTAFSFTPYFSLHTADPGTTGANEVVGGSYARVSGASSFGSAASGGTISTSASFSVASMPAATVTHIGVWDASSSGNFIEGGALSAAVSVATGQTFTCGSAQLTIGFSDSPTTTTWTTYLRNAVLNYMYRATAFSVTPYASLHTGTPGSSGANEATGGSYARFALTMTTPSAGATNNSNTGTTTGMPACTVTHQGIFDASSSGNFLMGSPYGAAIGPITAGDSFSWRAADVTATLV